MSENDALKYQNMKYIDVYRQQAKRSNCKICGHLFKDDSYLVSNDIKYFICKGCGHLNGEYEDTNEFCNYLYNSAQGGGDYSQFLNQKTIDDFNERTDKIFVPKVSFLLETLAEQKLVPQQLKYSDIGTGTGCFVNALHRCGLKNIEGYDVEGPQMSIARKILGQDKIKGHSVEDIYTIVQKLDCDVVSMIGVLEHFQKPHAVLSEICNNENIKYILISVPLFSLSVLFQICFPKSFERHLDGSHTHLFTDTSLDFLMSKYNLECVSEWWFGLDISDLFRNIFVTLDKTNQPYELKQKYVDWFLPLIDDLQFAIDRKKLSSEVHMVLKKI